MSRIYFGESKMRTSEGDLGGAAVANLWTLEGRGHVVLVHSDSGVSAWVGWPSALCWPGYAASGFEPRVYCLTTIFLPPE